MLWEWPPRKYIAGEKNKDPLYLKISKREQKCPGLIQKEKFFKAELEKEWGFLFSFFFNIQNFCKENEKDIF